MKRAKTLRTAGGLCGSCDSERRKLVDEIDFLQAKLDEKKIEIGLKVEKIEELSWKIHQAKAKLNKLGRQARR